MMLSFDLPSPAGCTAIPRWDGRNFVVGDRRSPVLEYSENFAGWSDDLTDLHEEAAGDAHPIDIASRSYAIAQVAKAMPHPGAVVMEVGCSSGFLIKDLLANFPEAVILGTDVVKEPLYRLAEAVPGVPLIRFDLLQCPLPAGSIDVLVMLNVLEHIEDDVGALEKAFQLLRPGGSLIVEVPAGPFLYDDYDAALRHFRRYSPSQLRERLVRAGFDVQRESHLGFVLFPAFALVKTMNKLFKRKDARSVVREQASASSASSLVRWAMSFESRFLSGLRLPVGIRAVATARKAATQ